MPHPPTPPLQRRLAKSFSVAPTLAQQKGIYQTPPFHTDDIVQELRGLSSQTSVSSVENSQNIATQISSTSHTTQHSHSHFSLSGSATSAFNALMGGHHHHHHHHHNVEAGNVGQNPGSIGADHPNIIMPHS
uniref:Uncharacterized protein n=1 Tax=Megaselia scalaris TaxID=36166 RepID=T1GYC0_MEGSC